MDKTLSLLLYHSPFEYISNTTKEQLNLIANILNNKSDGDLILLQDENIYKYLFFMHAIQNLLNNNDNSSLDIPEGTPVSYKNKRYYFQGIHENYIKLEEVPPKRKGKNHFPLIRNFPFSEEIMDDITMLTKTVRGKNQEINLNLLTDFLNLNNNKINIKNSLLVVCNQDFINEIHQAEFNVRNTHYSYSDIFSSVQVSTYNLEHTYVKSNRLDNITETPPAVIFVSNLYQAVNIIENKYSQSELYTRIKDVVVIGDSFLSENYLTDLNNLTDLTTNENIELSLYGSSSNIYSKSYSDLTNEFKIYSWSPQYVNFSNSFIFEYVRPNEEFNKKINELDNYIDKYKDGHDIYLKIKLYQIKNILLKQFFVSDINKIMINNELLLLSHYDIFDDEFLQSLDENNRHLYNFTNHLKSILKFDNEYILLVDENMHQLAAEFLSEHNLDNRIITENEYYKYSYNSDYKFISISPSKKMLIKYITSYRGKDFRIIYPDSYADNIQSFNNYINYMTSKTERHNSLNSNLRIDENWILSNNNHKLIDTINDSSSSDEIDDLIHQHTADLTDSEYYSADLNNIPLTVFTMKSRRVFFANDNSYFYYLNEDGLFAKEKFSKFMVGDKIYFLDLPYTNELFYQDKNELTNLTAQTLNGVETILEDDIKLNNYWKKSLRDYSKKFKLTVTELSLHFERLGYYKSVTFYQNWLDSDKNIILPQDQLFIFYIGKLTNDEKLIRNYKVYYEASSKIRRILRSKRGYMNDSILGKSHSDIATDFKKINITMETIENISSDLYALDSTIVNTLI